MTDTKYRIIQFGPDIFGVGGIETVIRAYTDLPWQHLEARAISTWYKPSRHRTRAAFLRALIELLRTRFQIDRPAVHVHLSHKGSFVREGAIVAFARLLGLRVFVTVHGSAFVASAQQLPWRPIYASILAMPRSVAVLNTEALAVAVALAPKSDIRVLANPGPIRTSRVHRSPGDCGPKAVFAGSVGYRKGVDTLLDAWDFVKEVVPDATLDIFGPMESGFNDGRLATYWRGVAGPEVLVTALETARLAVLPSRAEAMPMFILEAFGCGRPVVSTSVGAIPELLEGAGTLVVAGDVASVAEGILVYLEDPSQASLDGAGGKLKYDKHFGLRATEAALVTFYGLEAMGR